MNKVGQTLGGIDKFHDEEKGYGYPCVLCGELIWFEHTPGTRGDTIALGGDDNLAFKPHCNKCWAEEVRRGRERRKETK